MICRGHTAVRGTHRTTFEVTKEKWLTRQGDCIIGIGADKGAADLSPEFKSIIANDRAVLTTTLSVKGNSVTISSRGSSQMTLNHPTDLVWRKSDFICGRTIGIHSDYVARSLPRDIIEVLNKGCEMVVKMRATIPD